MLSMKRRMQTSLHVQHGLLQVVPLTLQYQTLDQHTQFNSAKMGLHCI